MRARAKSRLVFPAPFFAEDNDNLVEGQGKKTRGKREKGNRWKREDRLINSPCPLPITLARVSLVP